MMRNPLFSFIHEHFQADHEDINHEILKKYQYSSLILGFSFCTFYWYFSAWINLIAPAVFMLMVCLSIFLSRHNNDKFPSILLVISLWSAPAWCILFSGGINSPLLIWMTPTIFMAGALLGSRWALFIGTLSVTCIIVISFYSDSISHLSEIHPGQALTVLYLLSGTSAVGLITFYGYTFTRELKNKLIELERKEQQVLYSRDQAIEANNSKSLFLANMSHEIRTPLHGILSYALLGADRSGKLQDTKIKKYFSQIVASGDRLKVLLDDLLDLSKLEAGKMTLNIQQNNLPDIVNDCVNEQSAICQNRGIKIQYDIDKDLSTLDCDKNRIGQVVMNLLSNAIKFSPDESLIVIRIKMSKLENTDLHNTAILMGIEDQGPGIPKDDQKIIFNKFVQSTQSLYKLDGTGLGLAITSELINAHHGNTWCENAQSGSAIFYVKLPLKNN